jgi:probable rRNA maturation factor
MKVLHLWNRQRTRRVNQRRLRQLLTAALADQFHCQDYELGVHLAGRVEMSRINESFLNHPGPTDVITFDYRTSSTQLRGEIFVCPQVACAQSGRFRVTWESELLRYIVHGVLHLQGYDDKNAGDRQIMKRRENRIVRRLAALSALRKLGSES